MNEFTTDMNLYINELKKKVTGEVRFDAGTKSIYSTDASNYRQIPIGVVIPKTEQDVIETVKVASKYKLPVLSRGGGTSLAGQCCNTAIVIDFSKYLHNIIELNEKEKYAIVQPGIVLDKLRDEAEKYHLTFGPDPATHNHCTIGGMIGNNSCGVHSVMAGKTVDNIIELDILLYDGTRMTVGKTNDEELREIIFNGGRKGEIYKNLKDIRDSCAGLIRERYPQIPRRVSGYNLDDLLPENNFNVARSLVGTESTCVVVLRAKVKLVQSPPKRSLVVIGYNSIFSAGDDVPDVLEFNPIGLEGMDELLLRYMERKKLKEDNRHLLPDGNSWLLVEFGGNSKDESDGKAKKLIERLKNGSNNVTSFKLFDDKEEEEQIWAVRESGLGATAHIPGHEDNWPGWEDSAVHPHNVGKYLRDLKELFHKYNYDASVYGHFGQGCIHCRIPFKLKTEEGLRNYRAFLEEASDLVLKYGGSFSGEHGDGQARGELLEKMYRKELMDAFRRFKSAWDPDWKMNPGKVIDPYKITENLKIDPHYNPAALETNFSYTTDDGNFAKVSFRCVGVGKCRKVNEETMCPSYMVTMEEKHSTRGRARLLHEMVRGEVITEGWKSEHVKEALDLCLACKGCKSECPVNVDMATYKSEFLSHYYQGKIRPMSAYSMGLIYWWARIGSKFPYVTNFIMQKPGISDVVKKLGGIAPQRKMPEFAKKTFRKWYSKNSGKKKDKKKNIILWPDTFNNFFFPQTAVAGYSFLDKLGYNVIIPSKVLCCGRPLYDFGFLNLAKKLLQQILTTLKDDISEGVMVVGLEPSCITTFRDELTNLFPKNEDAKRLAKQTFTFSEFLLKEKIELPELRRKGIVHGHCHHKSILGFHDDEEILNKTGMDTKILDSGCCGMAGSFGFEKDKYNVSVDCGERVLLPKVREADTKTLVLADGFSCREQIEQLSDRRALHLAEVLYAASHNISFSNEDELLNHLKEKL